jgi:hypothetical protein
MHPNEVTFFVRFCGETIVRNQLRLSSGEVISKKMPQLTGAFLLKPYADQLAAAAA